MRLAHVALTGRTHEQAYVLDLVISIRSLLLVSPQRLRRTRSEAALVPHLG
jgi:hypothetical protein